jgi:hypothetical protein
MGRRRGRKIMQQIMQAFIKMAVEFLQYGTTVIIVFLAVNVASNKQLVKFIKYYL